MTKKEILSVTESDTEGCEAINKLVHEKLGLCWHEWAIQAHPYTILKPRRVWECRKCRARVRARVTDPDNLGYTPHYTHDIKAAWAIKEWIISHYQETWKLYLHSHATEISNIISAQTGYSLISRCEWIWASPLDRCKAFLLMEG